VDVRCSTTATAILVHLGENWEIVDDRTREGGMSGAEISTNKSVVCSVAPFHPARGLETKMMQYSPHVVSYPTQPPSFLVVLPWHSSRRLFGAKKDQRKRDGEEEEEKRGPPPCSRAGVY